MPDDSNDSRPGDSMGSERQPATRLLLRDSLGRPIVILPLFTVAQLAIDEGDDGAMMSTEQHNNYTAPSPTSAGIEGGSTVRAEVLDCIKQVNSMLEHSENLEALLITLAEGTPGSDAGVEDTASNRAHDRFAWPLVHAATIAMSSALEAIRARFQDELPSHAEQHLPARDHLPAKSDPCGQAQFEERSAFLLKSLLGTKQQSRDDFESRSASAQDTHPETLARLGLWPPGTDGFVARLFRPGQLFEDVSRQIKTNGECATVLDGVPHAVLLERALRKANQTADRIRPRSQPSETASSSASNTGPPLADSENPASAASSM